jgi:hypothetical protein
MTFFRAQNAYGACVFCHRIVRKRGLMRLHAIKKSRLLNGADDYLIIGIGYHGLVFQNRVRFHPLLRRDATFWSPAMNLFCSGNNLTTAV